MLEDKPEIVVESDDDDKPGITVESADDKSGIQFGSVVDVRPGIVFASGIDDVSGDPKPGILVESEGVDEGATVFFGSGSLKSCIVSLIWFSTVSRIFFAKLSGSGMSTVS